LLSLTGVGCSVENFDFAGEFPMDIVSIEASLVKAFLDGFNVR